MTGWKYKQQHQKQWPPREPQQRPAAPRPQGPARGSDISAGPQQRKTLGADDRPGGTVGYAGRTATPHSSTHQSPLGSDTAVGPPTPLSTRLSEPRQGIANWPPANDSDWPEPPRSLWDGLGPAHTDEGWQSRAENSTPDVGSEEKPCTQMYSGFHAMEECIEIITVLHRDEKRSHDPEKVLRTARGEWFYACDGMARRGATQVDLIPPLDSYLDTADFPLGKPTIMGAEIAYVSPALVEWALRATIPELYAALYKEEKLNMGTNGIWDSVGIERVSKDTILDQMIRCPNLYTPRDDGGMRFSNQIYDLEVQKSILEIACHSVYSTQSRRAWIITESTDEADGEQPLVPLLGFITRSTDKKYVNRYTNLAVRQRVARLSKLFDPIAVEHLLEYELYDGDPEE